MNESEYKARGWVVEHTKLTSSLISCQCFCFFIVLCLFNFFSFLNQFSFYIFTFVLLQRTSSFYTFVTAGAVCHRTAGHSIPHSGANSLLLCNEYLGTLNFRKLVGLSCFMVFKLIKKPTMEDIGLLNWVTYVKLQTCSVLTYLLTYPLPHFQRLLQFFSKNFCCTNFQASFLSINL